MAVLKHELWRNPEGLTTVCYGDARGSDCRALLDAGSVLIQVFEAESHFEAMTIYYKIMGWGEYESSNKMDKEPYADLDEEA